MEDPFGKNSEQAYMDDAYINVERNRFAAVKISAYV